MPAEILKLTWGCPLGGCLFNFGYSQLRASRPWSVPKEKQGCPRGRPALFFQKSAQMSIKIVLSRKSRLPPPRKSEDFSLLVVFLLATFSWLFRGFFVALFCLEKQCLGLFRYFFVAFSWPPFWANFTRTRPGTVFWEKVCHNFEAFLLICTVFLHFAPFSGKTKVCGQEFYEHPDFSDFYLRESVRANWFARKSLF